MAAELSRVKLKLKLKLKLTEHPWLLDAVLGAVEHFVGRAGFDAATQKDLTAATETACREAFKLQTSPDASIGVTLEEFEDRLEIRVAHTGEALPTAGLETFAGLGDGEEGFGGGGLALLALVDRVQYETQDGVSSTTLIRYRPKQPARA